MPAYCESHPVPPSPYADAHGPVSLLIGGPAEELVEASLGMDIDWETQLRVAHNGIRLEQLGWKVGDWSPALGGVSQNRSAPGTILCIDTNVLISHLAVLKSVHQALVSSHGSSSGLAFLVPSTVLRELDGLKSSTAPAERRGGPTIGDLAQRAVRWLVDVKRLERGHGIGRGLLVGDELDMNSQHAMEDNDGLILAAAVDTLRRAPLGTRLLLWTRDSNLMARAELQNLPTIDPQPPSNPHVFLHSIGVHPAEDGGREVDMEDDFEERPQVSPPQLAARRRVRETEPVPCQLPATAPTHLASPYDELLPFEAMLLIMQTHFPSAAIRRLTTFHRIARDAYDGAGLPHLQDLQEMAITLPMCFQILELIWRHQEGGWRSSALIPRQRRRPKPNTLGLSPSWFPSHTSSPSETRNLSMHAGSSVRSPPASPGKGCLDNNDDLLPPSAAHIRSHVLPFLRMFCEYPSVEGMPDFLEAVEGIFFGSGGRDFLGPTAWAELVGGVERCWLSIAGRGGESGQEDLGDRMHDAH